MSNLRVFVFWSQPLWLLYSNKCVDWLITYISACGGTSNAISNHNTTFSGSGNSVVPLHAIMCTTRVSHEEVVTLFTNGNGIPSDFSHVVPVVSWDVFCTFFLQFSSLVLTSHSRDFSLSVQDVILDNLGSVWLTSCIHNSKWTYSQWLFVLIFILNLTIFK